MVYQTILLLLLALSVLGMNYYFHHGDRQDAKRKGAIVCSALTIPIMLILITLDRQYNLFRADQFGVKLILMIGTITAIDFALYSLIKGKRFF